MNLTKDDTNTIIALLCQLQSALHTIDEISCTPIWKNELKNKGNSFSNFIENKVLKDFTSSDTMGISEAQSFVNIVTKFDELANEVRATVEVEQTTKKQRELK